MNIYDHWREAEYDAVLMDIRMPVMDGLEAAKKIRAMDREDAAQIPIIAMTANSYEEDIKSTKAAGMTRHLSKPVEPEILYQALTEEINKHGDHYERKNDNSHCRG